MGLIQHNAVIATTWNDERFIAVLGWLNGLPPEHRPLFVVGKGITNSYQTIALLPDGSKEGWDTSDRCDALRAAFMERLREDNYEDGSSPWAFADVSFGELGAKVEATNCEDVVSG